MADSRGSWQELGLEVVATDVSSVAVWFQTEQLSLTVEPTAPLSEPEPTGSLAFEMHDFRTPFRREAFDIILNVKAFQGFPIADLAVVAGVHADALRLGRQAFFFTQNVQGELRDQLEQGLSDGGFTVPFMALAFAYRRALRETENPACFHSRTPTCYRRR